MYKVSREQFTHFWDFLKTLDCYIKSESGMIEELEEFANNPNREIAALVCQNTSGLLTYSAPYIRIIYVLSGKISLYLVTRNQFIKKEVLFWLINGQKLIIKSYQMRQSSLVFILNPNILMILSSAKSLKNRCFIASLLKVLKKIVSN